MNIGWTRSAAGFIFWGFVKISACLITLNEARNLSRCLTSLLRPQALVDEIIVTDSGSTDSTVEIAQSFGARVLVQPWLGYVAQKNFALQQATHPWIFSIDADEEVSPELAAALLELRARLANTLTSPEQPAGYKMSRLVRYRDRWIWHGDWYPDRLVRLFRFDRARFVGGRVHERLEISGKVEDLPGHLYHFTYASAEDRAARTVRYAHLWAETAYECDQRAYVWSAWVHAAVRLLRGFILKGGFLDGGVGWEIAWGNAKEVWLKYDFLRQMNRHA